MSWLRRLPEWARFQYWQICEESDHHLCHLLHPSVNLDYMGQ